ncbi:hypothetical protein [Maritimibacter sp. HL-12]|uniref:hypothetical protein n=1 Tax=Maritimibacter sp. HL-12 TaxID=1162418 RepID=UPI00111BEEE6|nr:hypothetical protein [Maritimibacter sp. HL-12]
MVAFALFRFLGQTWLENIFSRKIEVFRHDNAKELAGLQARIDGSLSATVRSQEKEFAALSECWRLLNIAQGELQDYVSAIQQYQDIGKMPEDMRREFLDSLDLLKSQKRIILESAKPSEEYFAIQDRAKSNKAWSAVQEFGNAVFLNDIFVEEELSEEFKRILQLMRNTLVEKDVGRESGDHKISIKASRAAANEIKPAIEAIAPKLRKKFFERV